MILLSVVLFCFLSIFITTLRMGISPMPTSVKALKKLLEILPKNLDGTIYDLGSGFGLVAYLLAKKYPKATVTGIEISFVPYWIAKVVFFAAPNLSFVRKDYRKCDFSGANLIYCYLFPRGMEDLSQMDIRCALISNTFALPNREISKAVAIGDLYDSYFLFYGFYSL